MKIVVAGGSGFIGSHIVRRFLKEPTNRVWVLTRDPKRAALKFPHEEVDFIDLSKGWEFVKGAFEEIQPNVVVNSVGILYEDEKNTYQKAHVEFTKNLVEASKLVYPQRFIHISACGVGRNPYSSYFRTKLKAEEAVILSGLPYTIFRPSIVMGRGQLLSKQLREKAKFAPVIAVPKTRVQPLHVEDLADAVYLSAERENLKNKICEVGGEQILSMGEFMRRVLKLLGMEKSVVELPWWAFIPLLPLLKVMGVMTWEQLMMVRTENICPDNCLPKILPTLRNPFDIEL